MRRSYSKTRVIFFNAPSASHWGRPLPSRRRLHCTLCALIALSIATFCLAAYVFNNYTHINDVPYWTTGQRLRLTAVQSGDGLRVTWFSELNTRERLNKALGTSCKDPLMLEGDVGHKSTEGRKASPDQLMMAVTRDVRGDISLEDWLDDVIATRKGGIKLNFLTQDSVALALDMLAARGVALTHVPVWLEVNVVNGPGGDVSVVDAQWVMRAVNNTFPRAQLVFGWTAACCAENGLQFGRGSMENMLKVCRSMPKPIIVSAKATHAAAQWRSFRWLLESSSKLSLLLRSSDDDTSWRNDTSPYELLTVRNDWNKNRIFYDLSEAKLRYFRQLAETAGSPLHYFEAKDRDASRITWAHGANTEDMLAQAGRDGAMMVEGDVTLEGQGTSHQTTTPVMAHRGVRDKRKNASMPLRRWLDRVLATNKAIKLDIKSADAVVPTLKTLSERRGDLRRPVWLNGDILRGPNALHDPMNTTNFLKSVNAIFPEVTFSLGWTSGWVDGQDNEPYSWDMVEKMDKVSKKLRQPVNIAVRAVLARRSWEKLDWLLHQSRSITLTLWCSSTSSDKISVSDMDFVRHQSESSRVYFDVPPDAMPTL